MRFVSRQAQEPVSSFSPNDPACSSAASAPAAGGWRDIRPDLAGEQYVFATGPGVPPGASPFAVIREDEGLAMVLTRSDADRAEGFGLRYHYVAARITLRVDSGLADIGLTALVSRVLADAGISCNVIAGLAHDHLFVDWDSGPRALALLRALSR